MDEFDMQAGISTNGLDNSFLISLKLMAVPGNKMSLKVFCPLLRWSWM